MFQNWPLRTTKLHFPCGGIHEYSRITNIVYIFLSKKVSLCETAVANLFVIAFELPFIRKFVILSLGNPLYVGRNSEFLSV